jgi:predicted nucleic acid-binding Zn ribbon protein
MPRYNYVCHTCGTELTKGLGRQPTNEEILGSAEQPGAVFETEYLFAATKKQIHEATECPMCGGHDTEKTLLGNNQHFYMKGYGWLDRAGIKRDMNLHRLIHDEQGDPYAEHRVPGEVDDLATRLRKGVQKKPQVFDTKTKTKNDT